MSKLDELYKQKEAILKELNKLPNKQRDYKEYYKIKYIIGRKMNIEKIKINVIYKDIIIKIILIFKKLFKDLLLTSLNIFFIYNNMYIIYNFIFIFIEF